MNRRFCFLLFALSACAPDPGHGPFHAADCGPPSTLQDVTAGAWDPRYTVAGLAGYDGIAPTVHDFARDLDGSLLAVGYFHWMGQQRVEPMLRRRNGSWEPARSTWNRAVPRGGFSAIAVNPEGHVVLATNLGGLGVGAREIWLDRGDGFEVIGSVTGPVRALAWFDGKLWVAGTFQSLDVAARDLVVWDGSQWSAAPGGAINDTGQVYELLATDSQLLVAGYFQTIGGISATNVAAWNGSSWVAYNNTRLTTVFALAQSPTGELVAGGYTVDMSGTTAQAGGITQWTGTEWVAIGEGLSLNDTQATGEVSSLVFHGTDLYASGCFEYANGPPTNPASERAHGFARWDGQRWHALDNPAPSEQIGTPWVQYGVCGMHGATAIYDAENQALISDGNQLLAGGTFAGAGEVASQALIAYDGTNWVAQGAPADLGLNGSAMDLAAGGPSCELYALGRFTHAGGERTQSPVLRLRDGWEPMGAALPDDAQCEHLQVDHDGQVLLGCLRTATSEVQVLQLDGEEWRSLATRPLSEGAIFAMKVGPDGRIWVTGGAGGEFGVTTGFIAYVEDGSFQTLESGFDGLVTSIGFPPEPAPGSPIEIVIGGSFGHLDGQELKGVARWNGTDWTGLGAGLEAHVRALEYGRDAIYASTLATETAPATVSRWDGTAWTRLTTVERGFPDIRDFEVTGLREINGTLVMSGAIYPGSGELGQPIPDQGRNAYAFDGEGFTPFGGNLAASFVDAIAVTPNGVWFGGQIAEAGSGAQTVSSVGVAHFRWAE